MSFRQQIQYLLQHTKDFPEKTNEELIELKEHLEDEKIRVRSS